MTETPPVHRHTVDLPGCRISYLDFCAGAAEPTAVVLLHGGGVDSAALSWAEVGEALAGAGYRVLAPDHPGHGESPRPDWPVTQQRLVDYVGQFVDALDLRRYVIGGLSLGGGLTLGHVLARPGRVAGAILLDSYGLMPRLSDGAVAGGRQLLTWVLQRSGALDAMTRWMAGNNAALSWSIKSLIRDPARRTPELVDTIVAAARRPDGFAAFEQWQRDEVQWNRLRTDYTPQLASFPRPALIIHGGKDTGVPVTRARLAAELIPESTLTVIDDAGHWVQRDAPDVVIAAMLAFLRRLG
ncbi:alpha/beta hydrolase [Mycobacterium sp. 1274756.6]|uniref:alpha/beta fold hydrolase n=1 Tax=Mycobacterium sp. 1274756.6 TaxID=1834076 RepID=UPI000AEBF605|nr:alpha/beta hydrolase [Mycobacterium sp. 1274756.6]